MSFSREGTEEDGNSTRDEEDNFQDAAEDFVEDKEVTSTKNVCLKDSLGYRAVTKFPWLYKCLVSNPRISLLILGVLFPLFFLILLCFLFGLLLSKYEAPYEVATNNAFMRDMTKARRNTQAMFDTATRVPELCLQLYLNNESANVNAWKGDVFNDDIANEIFVSNQTLEPVSYQMDRLASVVNTTLLISWMIECYSSMPSILREFYQKFGSDVISTNGSLSFNWIRCVPGANGFQSYHTLSLRRNISAARPDAQAAYFYDIWSADQKALYTEYQANDPIRAYNMSLNDASGGSGCEYNGPAAAWFWFTVMTVIGFGNQVPATKPGRLMVYCMGAISIFSFGCVLVTAGIVVNTVLDGLISRLKCRWIKSPLFSCFLWAFLYHSWMWLIAYITQVWKVRRMGLTTFPLREGFWFSFMSATTIGFGEIYLEPEVFLSPDLISFPLLFLVSFVFLSAFLSKFAALVSAVYGQRTLLGVLTDSVTKTNIFSANTDE